MTEFIIFAQEGALKKHTLTTHFTVCLFPLHLFRFFFVASVSQKRQKESQTGGASKKHKPNRKSLGVPPKKNRKTGKQSCR